jgi:hypothetical protein
MYGRAKIGLLQARLIGATRAAVNIIEIASDPNSDPTTVRQINGLARRSASGPHHAD